MVHRVRNVSVAITINNKFIGTIGALANNFDVYITHLPSSYIHQDGFHRAA